MCVNTGFLRVNVVIPTNTEYTATTKTFIKSM
jgi:hypothetical protein